jgi:tetratricopeptide (TPR) repeat protein
MKQPLLVILILLIISQKPFAQAPFNDEANYWVKKAGEKINKNDDAGAIADINKAIALDPKFATAYVERGNAELDLEQYAAAIADYDRAIALDPKDGSAYFNRGYTKKVMGNYSGAKADFKLAFKYDPKQFQLFFDTGIKRIQAGLYDRALLVFDHAIDVNPACSDAYNARGYCYYKVAKTKADYVKAINDFDASIKLGGSNYKPLFKYRDSVVIAMNKADAP